MEAACSCSGVHQQDSLITAMLWKRMSTRCEVVMGDACSQGIFYPLHRERGTGIGSGVGGRICSGINQFGIRRWHWQPAL